MTYHKNTYGPTFGGGHDIHICNQANQSNGSYANICYTYINGNYSYQNI
jgi:hypothetical protein